MSEWRKLPLKEITVKIGSGSTPTGGSGAYKETGVSLIRSQNVLDFSFTNNGLAFIDEEQAHALRNVIVEPQDVLLNITGDSVTRCCSAPKEWLPARVNQHVAIIRANPKHLDSLFLKYSLISIKDELLSLSEIGGTRNALTKSMLENLNLFVPSVIEQKAIASVLSSLDNKIDLLHRQNKTLESMANALFRQWFIKEAQDDWVEGTLSSIASNVRENVTKQNISSEALYVGLEHIDRRNIALLKNGNGSDVDSNKSKFSTGDILFGKLRPYFHKVCTAPFDGICSTDILVIRPKNHNLQCFCLFAFFQDEVIEFSNIASGGTRMPRIDWTSLANYPISLPPDDKLNDFEKIVSIQVRRINFNVHKIKNLENLRGTLLPKLMSGEVRVQYAEEAIASVA
ncbi:restriction endonuclease subunit S [Pantoea sp. SJZ147]|uniref:restriction endonuclease subunit S n=1 Tax=Pantoea sp. SJZ147 TaxID=2572896 RepID=UPI0011A2BF2F|nr:restriction endonuclease subunit S [Pantoea sp. SJZ147]TWD45332.1 type I restriction enzyme S subunit [Pantoea sp. SJZ147]